jgi:hypothetical protein
MKKYLMLLCLSTTLTAQDYHLITEDEPVYDVEVIVFARLLGQPDATTLNPKPANLDVPYQLLSVIDEDWPMFQPHQPEPLALNDNILTATGSATNDDWQVPVNDEEPETEALVWVEFPHNPEHPVTARLATNPGIMPMHQQQWRQPATAFLNPQYVHVSSVWEPPTEEPETMPADGQDSFAITTLPSLDMTMMNNNSDDSLPTDDVPLIEDYAFDGAVAFSEQRFTHIQVKMNFYRHDINGELITYGMNQKNRIQLGEWHYFDHQQFGVLTKVTLVEPEAPKESESL